MAYKPGKDAPLHIAVIGVGYVGLVTGACLARFGFNVSCVDSDAAKIRLLQGGEMPFYEPDLEPLVAEGVRTGVLHFTPDLAHAMSGARLVFLAVGTPTRPGGALPDLTYLEDAARNLAPFIRDYTLLAVKSTVPVGTCRSLVKLVSGINPDADFDIASNPEFLRQGNAVQDFLEPDRIVAGIDSRRSREMLERLYAPITAKGTPLVFTTLESAELIKYAANTLLAQRVVFANEMADLCERTNANIRDVIKGIGLDARIGPHFLQPGPGFGGSCFPKDTLALAALADLHGAPSLLCEAIVESNRARKRRMAEKIKTAMGGDIRGKTIGVLGLTFKPGTDDMREAPSLAILPALMAEGAQLRLFDPKGMARAREAFAGDISWCEDAYQAAQDADALVVLTEWPEFKTLDTKKLKRLMRAPLIVDLRNIYKRQAMLESGFHYVSVGRRDVRPGEPWIPDLNPVEDDQ